MRRDIQTGCHRAIDTGGAGLFNGMGVLCDCVTGFDCSGVKRAVSGAGDGIGDGLEALCESGVVDC